MARFFFVLKFALIVSLCLAGVVALLAGIGISIPFVKIGRAAVYDLPAGGVLLLAAIGMAKFWVIDISEEEGAPWGGDDKPAGGGSPGKTHIKFDPPGRA